MSIAHFTIRHVCGRWVAHCHCHHPIGAWTATDLERKLQEIR